MSKDKSELILKRLKKKYPKVHTALNYSNAHELLFATILSAQCTDKRVNIVTKTLFDKYKTLEDFANADLDELKDMVRSTGFYNNKAKNIKNAAVKLVTEYNSEVPGTLKELVSLPGVARKTANVVLNNWFDRNEGIAVDTHVTRLSKRLGLTEFDDPKKIEKDLMKLYDESEWGEISLRLIEHGRATCTARKPDCANCILKDICPSAFKIEKDK